MTEEEQTVINDKQREYNTQKRKTNAGTRHQVAKQKEHRRKVYLDQRTKKWNREAANHDISKYPKQSFDPQKHVVDPNIFDPINAAKQFDQRTKNDDGSHQALVCVVCDELIKGIEAFFWIDEETLRGDDIKNRFDSTPQQEHSTAKRVGDQVCDAQ